MTGQEPNSAPQDAPPADAASSVWRTVSKRFRRGLVQAVAELFFGLVRRLPEGWDLAAGRGTMRLLRAVVPWLDHRMLDQLRLAYGTTLDAQARRDLAERIWGELAIGVVEFARMFELDPAQLGRQTVIYGGVHLQRAARDGRGVILLTGHMGNFEWLAAALSVRCPPWAVIVREKDDASTEALVDQVRRRFGETPVHKTATLTAVKLLRKGFLLGVAADQAASVGGVMATFLDLPAPSPLGPVVLAKLTGATVLPGFTHRDPNGRQTVVLHSPLALPPADDQEDYYRRGTQLVNDVYSARIRWRPSDWLWLHRRWKTPRSLWQPHGPNPR